MVEKYHSSTIAARSTGRCALYVFLPVPAGTLADEDPDADLPANGINVEDELENG